MDDMTEDEFDRLFAAGEPVTLRRQVRNLRLEDGALIPMPETTGMPVTVTMASRRPARPLAGAQDSDVRRGRNETGDALRRSEGGAR